MKNRLLVVNYHYIRKIIPSNGIHPITPYHFSNQLDLISKNGYDFISIENLNEAILKKNLESLPKKSCLITFDDGLKESYDNGYRILNEKGIPGVFYIISDAIKYKKLMGAHKIHYLRSILSNSKFIELLRLQNIEEQLNSEIAKEQYIFDDEKTAKLKYILNFIVNDSNIIDKIFLEVSDIDEKILANDLYMSAENIKDLSDKGFLGTHGKNHVPLAKLSSTEIYNNIRGSMDYIAKTVGKSPSSISYPYGETTAISKKLFNTCKDLNLISGFTMKRGINTGEDIINNPLELKRFDTNEVYGGKFDHKI